MKNNFDSDSIYFNFLVFSLQEVNPWLKIQLGKEFFIYEVKIETVKNMSDDSPLTVTIWSRNQSEIILGSVCVEKQSSGFYWKYKCLPPVKGEFLRIVGANKNTTLVLCHITVLGLGQ